LPPTEKRKEKAQLGKEGMDFSFLENIGATAQVVEKKRAASWKRPPLDVIKKEKFSSFG